MAERGLLKKAQKIRAGAVVNGSDLKDFSFDESSGISKEDQKDILRQIDQVAQSNRILAGPDTWTVRPRKRGFAAPLIVNLTAILVLTGGLFFLWSSFGSSKSKGIMAPTNISTAEGRLLQELKRESEGQIQEKDRQITSIQEKLNSLDNEKAQLLSSVEGRIKAKETELKQRLAEELQKERQRLIAAGVAESTVEERLKAFEKEKAEALKEELNEYTQKVDAERAALQTNMDKAREEYVKALTDASSERQKIQEDSRKREQELRSQLDEKSRALESERNLAAGNLDQAQKELGRMNEEARRNQAAEDRLIGMYASARQALQAGRLDDASRIAGTLRQFLAEPSVSSLGALQRRRDSDLFAADLVDRTVAAERAKSAVDVTRVSDALTILAQMQDEGDRAKVALSAGDEDTARQLYTRMLSATPELRAAYSFLKAGEETSISESRAVKESEVASAYKSFDAAYASRDWAAVDAAFKKLLSSLSLGDSESAAAVKRIKESGVASAIAARRAANTVAAVAPLREASAALNEQRWGEAVQGYASVLIRFPEAEQIPQAVEGLRLASRGLANAFQEFRDQAKARIESLELRLSMQKASTEARPEAPRSDSSGVSTPDNSALQAEKEVLEKALAESESRYKGIKDAYASFAADEKKIKASGGPQTLVAGRSRMDSFFSNGAITAVMPGMRDRVAGYMEAYQTAGEKEVLFNAADIVEGASRIRDPAVRERYFKDVEARYSQNATMLEFLKTIREIFKST